jgi:ornithine decarboxylase
LTEIEDARTIPEANLHFMHPVKSRTAIRRAFAEFGVRSFALDSEDELKKIAEETGGCRDLTLWVRIAVTAKNSKIPLERKYGVAGARAVRLLSKARQAAKTLGVTFHVGSQTATPDAFVQALAEVGKLIGRRTGALVGLRLRHCRWRRTNAGRRTLPADVRARPRPGGGGRVIDRARRRSSGQ